MKFVLEMEIPDIAVERLGPCPVWLDHLGKEKALVAVIMQAACLTMRENSFDWGVPIRGPGAFGPFAGGNGCSVTISRGE